jgi:hypothetical protein
MRFRFTIRDLCWLIVLASLVIAWTLGHRKLSQQIDQLRGGKTISYPFIASNSRH